MKLVDVVLEGTSFKVVNVKRSPVTKKLLVRIDDKHSNDLSMLCPNKVISRTFSRKERYECKYFTVTSGVSHYRFLYLFRNSYWQLILKIVFEE